jgi:oligoribonuclease
LADIHESIRELQFYRRTAFVPLPGPSTSEIEAVVADLQNGDSPAQTIDSDTEPTTG